MIGHGHCTNYACVNADRSIARSCPTHISSTILTDTSIVNAQIGNVSKTMAQYSFAALYRSLDVSHTPMVNAPVVHMSMLIGQ